MEVMKKTGINFSKVLLKYSYPFLSSMSIELSFCSILQVKAADNRIIQEQLNQKVNNYFRTSYKDSFSKSHDFIYWLWLTFFYQISECEGLQETVASLKLQLADTLELRNTPKDERLAQVSFIVPTFSLLSDHHNSLSSRFRGNIMGCFFIKNILPILFLYCIFK